MVHFADADEVYRYIGRLFEEIVADEELGRGVVGRRDS